MPEQKNDFDFLARKLISIVDFIKWTSTFGEGFLKPTDVPMAGVRLGPSVSYLFGIAQDEAGLMLTMHESEGGWLQHFPFTCAFVGFDDELLLASEHFVIADTPFNQIGIAVFIPNDIPKSALVAESTLGFGLVSGDGEDAVVTRVNRIIPLYDPQRYAEEKSARTPIARLFS